MESILKIGGWFRSVQGLVALVTGTLSVIGWVLAWLSSQPTYVLILLAEAFAAVVLVLTYYSIRALEALGSFQSSEQEKKRIGNLLRDYIAAGAKRISYEDAITMWSNSDESNSIKQGPFRLRLSEEISKWKEGLVDKNMLKEDRLFLTCEGLKEYWIRTGTTRKQYTE